MKNSLKTLGMWLIIAVIFIVLLTTILDNSDSRISYSDLLTKIEASEVQQIEVTADADKAYVTLKGENNPKEVNIPNIESFMEYVQEPLKTGNIKFTQRSQSIIITLLGLLTPFGILIIFLIFWFLVMNGQQSGTKTMTFGKSKTIQIKIK